MAHIPQKQIYSKDEIVQVVIDELQMRATRHQRADTDRELLIDDLGFL